MSTSFEKYSDILLDAFKLSARSDDIASKKQEILNELLEHYSIVSGNVLFIGFNPSILTIKNYNLYLTESSQEVRDYLTKKSIQYQYIEKENIKPKFFDVVIAIDEYLTFAATDSEQREKVEFLSSITNNIAITTLKDYKNQDFKDREFGQPIVIRSPGVKRIYLEHYEYSISDRNFFLATNYTVSDDDLVVIGPFTRRSMFFKQLAKFSFDAGAKNFLVHQNLMHKSMIKKNYEHILTIKF